MTVLDTLIARTILQGFDAQYGRFLEITAGAQQRFEQADWQAVQLAMKARIHLYDHHVGLVVEQLRCITASQSKDRDFLLRVKEIYTHLLPDYPRFEIAESFFNSVYCRLFSHQSLTPERLFIFSSQPEQRFRTIPRPLAKTFSAVDGWRPLLNRLLHDLPLRLPWQNMARDIDYIVAHLRENFTASELQQASLQVANELFYRNKAAWLVAKLRTPAGVCAFLLPIHRSEEGELFIDTCLTRNREASIVFGFARSYFMVYAPLPAALVEWLREILPGKTTAELYMAIGCQKHGKTETYREYLNYMRATDEQFVIAPGVPGLVMLVFTLPGFDRVFKVIKDRFAPQKEVTPERVRQCYQLVKEHDRVGRMADTQEFENFAIEEKRLSPALLALLEREVPEKLQRHGEMLTISHLYMERRMTPLNLWLEQADAHQRREAIEEYGNAVKQLAAANIFPGDMLYKNFGVTRHGRVVFYDYDEISYMTEVNFRDIPAARYPEDELSHEPWYSVSPEDVFPEEFRHYLCADPAIATLFDEMHAELFHADFWRGLQQRIRAGHIEDVFAYRRRQRFSQRYPTAVT
ncbi:bifunctional isocitrate dehydrogenase kinase/phosphatase [Erwinia sorbitola]|uniref:Isocitrate dehydrogenase kinase/phosphatase n=1 Tax=Erwinia sorbitola TaxID=2681984 RepID=A0A6I6EYH1_9GAMM|nr:bifunctional isocitrate dehydrogenase kinase/phosphatase [Erwinia sorbitola]MTD28957.1 bifunctional isocitrate dehydrogenase kinase/phosphatase [Erwinia sorbitola]QGU89293.1 bifunctional isocitrate dehydrogenase kinase/phosphatase [Erwinia sorbitola]